MNTVQIDLIVVVTQYLSACEPGSWTEPTTQPARLREASARHTLELVHCESGH